jgi:hypothetical protein
MEATSATAPIENEEFWRHHNQMQKTSGLTRADYCRKNGLNYDRFGYWVTKRLRKSTQETKLVSVKVKPANESASALQSILCTLNLSSGHSLKIHDTNALSIILDKMR